MPIKNKKLDIILVCVPRLSMVAPLPAIALLKAILLAEGINAKTIDLNEIFYNRFKESTLKKLWDAKDTTFFYREKYIELLKDKNFNKALDHYARKIAKESPKWVGVGIYGKYNISFTADLCFRIKQINPNIKTVIGGPFASAVKDVREISSFIDHFIVGDADKSLLELLQGNLSYDGIDNNNSKQFKDLDSLPFPNYDDYNLSNYILFEDKVENNPKKSNYLYLSGSRGCCFNCTYCEIKSFWPKYIQRSGESTAGELIYLHKKYSINKFIFTDNLVNADVLELEKFCKKIVQAKKNNEINSIIWKGHFCCRSQEYMNKDFFKLLRESGCSEFIFGIESGSEKVRFDMRKPLKDEDLDFCINELVANEIKVTILMMVGYPTETDDDLQKTLDMFDRYVEFKDKISVYLGATLSITEDTYLYSNLKKLGIKFYKDERDWVYKGNTPIVRYERWFKLQKHVSKLGYEIIDRQYEIIKKRYDELVNK